MVGRVLADDPCDPESPCGLGVHEQCDGVGDVLVSYLCDVDESVVGCVDLNEDALPWDLFDHPHNHTPSQRHLALFPL